MRGTVLLMLALGCAGKATGRAEGQPDAVDAVGGGGTSLAGGGGLTLPVHAGGTTPGGDPVTCSSSLAPSCGIKGRSYVWIDDGPSQAQLSVPFDEACAACGVPCEDCPVACEVSATGAAACGRVTLSLAVCAGEGQTPPCLNTGASDPYYIDRDGAKWSVVALSGPAETSAFPASLEADLTLELRDGDTTRELATHVRVCADLSATLVPCK